MQDSLKHIGTPRHSGRYPWGSGGRPQRNRNFSQYVGDLRKKGLSEKDIADGMNMKTSQLREKISIEKDAKRRDNAFRALTLKDKGYSNVEIGRRMGKPESSIRALLNPVLQERANVTRTTANILKDAVDKKKYIDVGVGVERHMGVHRTKLKTAVAMLRDEGYRTHRFDIEQLGTGKKTNMLVLTKDDVTYSEVLKNKDKIRLITDYSEDGGRSFLGIEPIKNVDSKRIQIRYAEQGGADKDGVIELRRGPSDISLGNSKYAQVRIGVDGTHYLKGMAMYGEKMPKDVDIIFNTNKKDGTPKEEVFKKVKRDKDGVIDDDNPFGSTVRQQHYITEKGLKTPNSSEMLTLKRNGISYSDIAKKFKVSEDLVRECITVKALNIVYEEGDWGKWSKTLSSQVLSKQDPSLAKQQLKLAYGVKHDEFDEIMSLTNPTIKKKLLEGFASDCDSSAVHLKAAALPRQGSFAILPFPDMKPNEIYAPKYRDGENVVLIRYPHGGIFEIPQLQVNNKHPGAKRLLGDAADAVGINPKVAERLSGADFDGDTVLVIPNPTGSVKTSSPLKGLEHFDPKESYAPYDGMHTIDGGIYNAKTKLVDYGGKNPRTKTKQMQMGNISNLITDMTIKGASPDKIAKAVRHSMVVIDSEKHHLDYKTSAINNGISALKKEYQGGPTSGASTLISRASSEKRVDVRKVRPADPITGKKIYDYNDEPYINKQGATVYKNRYTNDKGKVVYKTEKSTKMAETDDAFTLSSGTIMETVYATHANSLKALANTARKEAISTPLLVSTPSARIAYAPQVSSLNASLNIALKNSPLERQAQLLANSVVAAKRRDSPNEEPDSLKKLKGQALEEARTRMNAKKKSIPISDKEWEAIQAGAISNSMLTKILNNTDLDKIKQLATPRATISMPAAKLNKAKNMLAAGRTQREVADALGVSMTVLSKAINS